MRKYLLVGIILLGFLLRFYGLSDKGITDVDEGTYILEAAFLNGEDPRETDLPFYTLKPGYAFFISVSQWFFGNTPFSGLAVSAFFSTLSIFLVYLIASNLYGRRVGLISAFVFSVLGIEIIFARNVYAETTMMFFFLLSVLFYLIALKEKKPYQYLLAGIFAGLSFEAKFTGAAVLILLLLWGRPKRYLYVLLGFSIVFFLTWIAYGFLGISYSYFLLERLDQFAPFRFVIRNTFLDNIPRLGSEYAAGQNLLYYSLINLFHAYKTIGILMLALLCLGVYCLARGWTRNDRRVLVWFGFMVLSVFLIASLPRMLMYLPPVISILIAKVFDKRGYLILGIFSLISLYPVLVEISEPDDAYRDAAGYLKAEGAEKVLSVDKSITTVYMWSQSRIAYSYEDLLLYRERGYTHILLNSHFLGDKNANFSTTIMGDVARLPPEKIFPYSLEWWVFPFDELELSDCLYDKTGISLFHKISAFARGNMMTGGRGALLMVYDLDSVIDVLKPSPDVS